MPFEIIRNDITRMHVDMIVNPANPMPIVGGGCDAAFHQKAGPKLLEAREKIGEISAGEAAITPGFALPAACVIHTVGPVWIDGEHLETELLRKCYENSLLLALENGCRSIAFPLISGGVNGFPKEVALQTAISAISGFLMQHEMEIYLVVFAREAYALSEKLLHSVRSYIDENYVCEVEAAEYFANRMECAAPAPMEELPSDKSILGKIRERGQRIRANALGKTGSVKEEKSLIELLRETDAGFSETLLRKIDATGKKDSEIYKKANVDRKLFSKIRNDPGYRPSKTTALAFAIALELDLEETKDLIGRAGYALSHSSKGDIIVEYFIVKRNYDIFEINAVLFEFDQKLLGT